MTRAAAAIALLLLAPGAAWPHAALVKSSPAVRAAIDPPRRVELAFNERLEAAYSSVEVWSADGQRVDARNARVGPDDPKRLSVGVVPLRPGVYTVKYRVLSVDGHVIESSFTFTVRTGPP